MPRDVEMLGEGKKWTEGKGESSTSCKAHENGNIMALTLYEFSHTTLPISISHCLHLSNMYDTRELTYGTGCR
jgi:hypothetical protein